MMAFAQLEPFGALAEDFRAGQICATLANVHRDSKTRPDPWTAADFMPALDAALAGTRLPPVLLADPVAQSDLIRQQVFRKLE